MILVGAPTVAFKNDPSSSHENRDQISKGDDLDLMGHLLPLLERGDRRKNKTYIQGHIFIFLRGITSDIH
jgi:hypothetical protein